MDRDGYVLVKVQNDGPWHHRWKHKHKVIWEKINGPVPKGHCLVFLDGNKHNISLENLKLVPKSQMAILNRNRMLTRNKDINEVNITIAGIYEKISQRKKGTSK